MRRALAAFALSCAAPVAAQDFTLQSPIECDLTTTCHIQQYMDHDPTSGVRDYTCAALSYDGHKGTDFALPSTAMMARGVAVLAAAPGIVQATRDGMPDEGITASNAAALEGRECGNGVVITHENGWVTQYCHLKQGSVQVTKGDRVAAGDPLALVGQSGRAAFPHVHLGLRKDGETSDPFDTDNTLTCSTPGDTGIWQTPLPHRPGGLIALGFADAVPDYADVKAGTAGQRDLTPQSPALVIWAYSFGTRQGDILRLTLEGPDGTVITDDIAMTKPQAQSFRAIGKKRRANPWPAGVYMGTVTLIRKGEPLEMRKAKMTLR